MKLLKVDTLDAAVDRIRACSQVIKTETEYVDLTAADGRVAACDVASAEMIPPYRRSTVDGFALRSSDVKAASEMIPTLLKQIGEVSFGCFDAIPELTAGSCVYVPTGGMVPDGADAMVMVEYTEDIGGGQIAVMQSVAPGNQVVQIGEDIRTGDVLVRKGQRIRPQDVGVLAAAGICDVPVVAPWHVTVISTGDELVEPQTQPLPGQIRDINTYSITARLREEGFVVDSAGRIPDIKEELKAALIKAKEQSDIVIVSGGSSQGKKDATAELIGEICDRGVLTHGLAVKPGKPTITGVDEASGTLCVGLPGHPAAAMMILEQTVIRLWRECSGQRKEYAVTGRMASNVPASPGRRTFQLVEIEPDGEGGVIVKPVFAKSGMILPYAKADGYIVMTENQEGVRAGDAVEVLLWK